MLVLMIFKVTVPLHDGSINACAKYYWSDPILVEVTSKHRFLQSYDYASRVIEKFMTKSCLLFSIPKS